jgi:hypothetical protein
LILETGASSTEIDLPERAGTTSVRVRAGAAGVVLNVPRGVAARVRGSAGIATIDVDTRRFPHVGEKEYRSPDFDTAANRVDIDIETGVGSVAVHSEE